jgi:hypothetical protein
VLPLKSDRDDDQHAVLVLDHQRVRLTFRAQLAAGSLVGTCQRIHFGEFVDFSFGLQGKFTALLPLDADAADREWACASVIQGECPIPPGDPGAPSRGNGRIDLQCDATVRGAHLTGIPGHSPEHNHEGDKREDGVGHRRHPSGASKACDKPSQSGVAAILPR